MPGSGEVEGLLADLARWASEQRVDEAVRARTAERWLTQQAGEEARLEGLAVDLAEQTTAVALRTVAGRAHFGRVVAVGRDFVALRGEGGRAVFVPLAAVATIRPEPGARVGTAPSERTGTVSSRLGDVVLGLSAERPRVQVVAGGDPVAGELRGVGTDLLWLRLDTSPPATVYVALGALTELSLLVSG